jgi:hypothetical protein
MSGLLDVIAGARAELEASIAEADDRARYQADPVGYCRDVLRFEPWSKQREVLESVRDHKRTAVRSSHGTGKTAIAGRAALWFLDSFENSRVITTAPTWAQVKDLLWREIHVAHYAAAGKIGGKLHDAGLELGPDWFAVGLSTNEPERFQGHHAEHLLLIVDESSGVSTAIFNAAQGFLTAHGARLLLLGNPTQLSGEFFDAFHTKRAGYNLISISTFDTPAFTGELVAEPALRSLPTPEWVAEMRALYGEESPLWAVRVLGEFARQPDDSIIALAALEAAQVREREKTAPVVIGCDVARFGSDETVIALRHGERVRIAKVLSGRDTMTVVGEILRVARGTLEEAVDFARIVVDDVGLGGGVTDRLRELKREGSLGALRVTAFNGAERSRAPDDYPNRRSEVWFEFADRLETLDLDADEKLAADLVAPTYKLDSKGRRVVEPKADTKRRLGRSPDRGDAVLLTFALPDPRSSSPADVDDSAGDGVLDDGVRYGMRL